MDPTSDHIYKGSCFCGLVRFAARAPVGAIICHCRACQKLHGAPMQWAAVFNKSDFRFLDGSETHLAFFNTKTGSGRILPCRVTCEACHTRIGDEGRNMFFSFPSLFDFGEPHQIPDSFKPTCHLFYGSHIVDMRDDLPKYMGKRGSALWSPDHEGRESSR